MSFFQPTIIFRHKKENLKKCSLRGLETRNDLIFYRYPRREITPVSGYCLLTMDGQILSEKDREHGLLILDGTWRYAKAMEKGLKIEGEIKKRSLPSHFRTAYPRRQTDCPNPDLGLATVEALAIAYILLGRDPRGLLDHYHWKELFLSLNRDFLDLSLF